MLNNPRPPRSPLNVDYESEDAKIDSEYQVQWSKIMDKGSYNNPSTYKKVAVLLLRWAENSDNLATESEVQGLERVFKDRFHFTTQMESLNPELEQTVEVQLNGIIAQFVRTHDGLHTLLIVYYAGHGRPGNYYGSLEFHNGRSSPNDEKENSHQEDKKTQVDNIVWNHTETLLYPAKANILEIFDCCHAGALGPSRGYKRPFEYLAATQAMAGTRVPGKDSFTSALVHALEFLVDQKPGERFTTVELLGVIRSTEHCPNFPKDQTPVLSDREHSGPGGRIMLHPIQPEGTEARTIPKELSPSELDKRRTVTLHFDFDEMPPRKHIEHLGTELNNMFKHSMLNVNGIRWGGLKPSFFSRAIQTFLKVPSRRNSMRRDRENASSSDCSEGWPTQQSPGLLAPSPMAQQSWQMHQAIGERDIDKLIITS